MHGAGLHPFHIVSLALRDDDAIRVICQASDFILNMPAMAASPTALKQRRDMVFVAGCQVPTFDKTDCVICLFSVFHFLRSIDRPIGRDLFPVIGEATAFPGHRGEGAARSPAKRRSVKGSGQNKTEGSGVSLKAVFF